MQIDLYLIVLGMSAGVVLGIFYFGGLWWTLNMIRQRSRPYRLLGVSFLARTVITLTGFWWLLNRGIPVLFIALGMFFCVRIVLIRKLAPAKAEAKQAVPS